MGLELGRINEFFFVRLSMRLDAVSSISSSALLGPPPAARGLFHPLCCQLVTNIPSGTQVHDCSSRGLNITLTGRPARCRASAETNGSKTAS